MTMPRPVRTDARGRLSLGEPDTSFLLWEQPDGALVLEPAVMISKTEAALLADGELQKRIALAHEGLGLVRRSAGRRDATAS